MNRTNSRFDLTGFEDVGLSPSALGRLLDEHDAGTRPELERLWSYYRNPRKSALLPTTAWASPRTRLAQEDGLPPRLRGVSGTQLLDDRAATKEIVIENDIGWRVDAMVDFVFGKPLTILSTSPNSELRPIIERVLDRVWEASGGIQLFQDIALIGGVYGFADLVVRGDELFSRLFVDSINPLIDGTSDPDTASTADSAQASLDALLPLVRIELVEGTRAIPMLSAGDYRVIDAYVIRSQQRRIAEMNSQMDGAGDDASLTPTDDDATTPTGRFADRLAAWLTGASGRRAGSSPAPGQSSGEPAILDIVEVLSPSRRKVFENGRLVYDAVNPLGELAVVHIQNASQPFAYAGVSDVEPLIPLQDELNTRLSDRAHRVTLQSFNMYLAKGLDGFGAAAIGPGQVWSTDNPDARVESFGGDAHAPSEVAHIDEVRDAMDKASGVSPVALGVIRAKLGHLSSENALRITLNGVLSKTARKRVSYGRGIAQVCRLVLTMLDKAGVLKTTEADRGVRLHWQDPLPLDERARLSAALLKRDLGVPVNELLAELGYAREDAGVG